MSTERVLRSKPSNVMQALHDDDDAASALDLAAIVLLMAVA
jgi:hypothetical protein